jgi:hypothetical protein
MEFLGLVELGHTERFHWRLEGLPLRELDQRPCGGTLSMELSVQGALMCTLAAGFQNMFLIILTPFPEHISDNIDTFSTTQPTCKINGHQRLWYPCMSPGATQKEAPASTNLNLSEKCPAQSRQWNHALPGQEGGSSAVPTPWKMRRARRQEGPLLN